MVDGDGGIEATLASVRCGENFFASERKPAARVSRSIWEFRVCRISAAWIPTQTTRGRSQFGYVPTPLSSIGKGEIFEVQLSNPALTRMSCSGVASPRNFKVRWIFCGLTGLKPFFRSRLCLPVKSPRLACILAVNGTAMKERIKVVIFLIARLAPLYTFYLKHGISPLPCCARDAATSVLSQHVLKGFFTQHGNAIGFDQGGSMWQNPPASAGSKLCSTRHGGGFFIKNCKNQFVLLVDNPLHHCYTINR